MPYCPKCGTKAPDDAHARFCPSCGAPLIPRTRYAKSGIIEAFKERRIGALRSRVIVAVIMVALCFTATFIGAVSELNNAEVQELIRQSDELQEAVKYAGVQLIFGVNFMHFLIMVTPGFGPIYGFFILWNTGRGFAAVGSSVGLDPLLLVFTIIVLPFAWLEYISYGIAVSESLWLIYMASKSRFKAELTNAAKVIAICAVLLLLAAFIEMFLIATM